MQNITTTPPVDLTNIYASPSQNVSFRVTIDSDGSGTFIELPNCKAVDYFQNAFYPFEYNWEEKISKGKIIFTNKEQEYGNFFTTGGYSDYFVKRRKVRVYQSIFYDNPPVNSYEFLLFTALVDSSEYANLETVILNIVGPEIKLKETILKDEGFYTDLSVVVADVKKYALTQTFTTYKGVAFVKNSLGEKINPGLYSYSESGGSSYIAFDKTIPAGTYTVRAVYSNLVSDITTNNGIIKVCDLCGITSAERTLSGTSINLDKPLFTGKSGLQSVFELCQVSQNLMRVDYDGKLVFQDFPSGTSVYEFRTDNTGLPGFRPTIDDSERYEKVIVNGSNSEYNSFFDIENATPIANDTGTILASEFEKTVEITIPNTIRAESIRIEGAVSGTARPTTPVLVGFQPGYQIDNNQRSIIDTPAGTGLVLYDTDPNIFSNLYLTNLITSIKNPTGSLSSGTLTLGFSDVGSAWNSGTITFLRNKRFFRITPAYMSLPENVVGEWKNLSVEYSLDNGATYYLATENTHYTVSKTNNDLIISPVDHGISSQNYITALSGKTERLYTNIGVTDYDIWLNSTDAGVYPVVTGNDFVFKGLTYSGGSWNTRYFYGNLYSKKIITDIDYENFYALTATPTSTALTKIDTSFITHLRFSVTFQPQSRSNSSTTLTMPASSQDSELVFRNFAISGTGGGTLNLNDVQMFVNRRTISAGPPENFVYELTVSLINDKKNTSWEFSCDWVKVGDILVEAFNANGEIGALISHTKETKENYSYNIYGIYIPSNLNFSLVGIQNNKVFVKITHNKGYADSYSINVYGKKLIEFTKDFVEGSADSLDSANRKTLLINNQYIETTALATTIGTAYLLPNQQKTIEFDKVGGLLPLELCDKITIDPQGIYQAVSAMPLDRFIRFIRWYMEYSESGGMFSEQKIIAKEF